ncbi:MAG: Fe-S cluster assembly protein SufD [Deltaproteobacteria bacterium]|nr:Fe-S cluster assembly protein SufD [Deltaproteobacteria bacterium]
MNQALAEKDHYLSIFERCDQRGAGPAWVQPLRQDAISRFAVLGFPTTKDEEWKYTNVSPILQFPFRPAPPETEGSAAIAAVERATAIGLPLHRLVFVNGHYAPRLSSVQGLRGRVRASSLRDAFAEAPDSLKAHLARYADHKTHAFVALNTAFMEEGAYLYVPKGAIVEEPVLFLFLSIGSAAAAVSYPRNLIVAGQGSQVTVVEAYLGSPGAVYLTNGVTEIAAGEDAVVDHYKLVEESDAAFHVATQQARLERSANFVSHLILLGGALVRNDVNAVLEGEGIECTLNGLFMATDRQHVDSHTRIDHVRPHGCSRELYKGILSGGARGVFNGKIYVHKSAPKTDAKQTNKNLLLSEEALVDTKPQLEIYNNDVKCTHGSTIGQLDQDALFYLRARGIGLAEARNLLTYAFASEIIRGIKVASIRDQLDRMVRTRLENQFRAKERGS